jgi:hypothetical protein
MTGKDSIESVVRSLREEVFHRVSLHAKRRQKVREDTGKRGSESTFVHFRQLFQEGGMGLPSLDITGIGEHTARLCGEAGSGGVFPFVPCLCGNMEEGHFFENQQTSTFVN